MNIIGMVVNMSGFVCPKCSCESDIFVKSKGAEQLSTEQNIPILAHIPLDPALTRACDEGQSYFEVAPNSSTTQILRQIAAKLEKSLAENNNGSSEAMEQ